MSDCAFCEIIAGQAPVSTVYDDDTVIGIMTIGPVNPGHVMVIPRVHYPYMRDMDEETGMHLFKIALRMEQAIRGSGVRCEGINMFLADGEAAFQEIFHLHMHVFPRFKGDPFKIDADWSAKPPREELARIHRRTSLGTALEEASGCPSESGIMVLEQKPARKQGAPNRCCHRTNPTVSASSLTTIAWWPMPACSCRPP